MSFGERVKLALESKGANKPIILDSSSDSASSALGNQLREERRLAKIQLALEKANEAKEAKVKHVAYQAVFTRNGTEVCAPNPNIKVTGAPTGKNNKNCVCLFVDIEFISLFIFLFI